MRDRINKLHEATKELAVDAVWITDPYNMRYYSGFSGGEGLVFVGNKRAVLITDSRYTEAAQAECDIEVMEANVEHPQKAILMELLQAEGASRVGFEDEIVSVSTFNKWKDTYESVTEWIPLGEALYGARQVKDEEELALLRRAEAIGDHAFSHILDILKPGLTELEVKAELEYDMVAQGAEGTSFDTIVASGLHSSMPHAVPTEKKLEVGDFVTMDFGCIYRGYCSDMTRTVVIGKANDRQRKIYETVLRAQSVTEQMIHTGMICKEVDRIARDIIEDAGYGAYFGHGLGHSVGLEIHESPACNRRDETVLCEGMIMTVEPGIYIPGFGGVRIEDMGVVTKQRYESFAKSPKRLIEL